MAPEETAPLLIDEFDRNTRLLKIVTASVILGGLGWWFVFSGYGVALVRLYLLHAALESAQQVTNESF